MTEYHHYDTSTRSRVKEAVEFMNVMSYDYNKQQIFDVFNVKRTQGFAILSSSDRRHPELETRGRKPKITSEQVGKILKFL